MGKRVVFLSGVSVLALGVAGATASGLPSSGKFSSGKGSIATSGTSLTVKQSSTNGVIDWKTFSIGTNNSVAFNNGNGATLNRVTGGNLSRIAGTLHATGSLFVMNAAGVIVTGTGRVMTGGSFVASSGQLSGDAFGDDSRFKVDTDNVINRGSVVAGGTATLAGNDVTEKGTVRASAVTLSATRKLAIDGAVTARNRDGSGGTVIATARHITVGGGATVDASGTKGGTVLIGGDIHGGAIAADNFVKQNVRTAQTTTIAAGAHISADGSDSSGGNIVIWSDGHTSFAGHIRAKGKTEGGFAEVSSHVLLGFTGTTSLTSTFGRTGILLLDPENVTIENGKTTGGTLSGGTFTPTGKNSVLSISDLERALASANVIVSTGGSTGSQTGDITVLNPVTWASPSKLTLDAYHSIYVGATISITGTGGLALTIDDGGTGGGYFFEGGNIAFGDIVSGRTKGSLKINSTIFTLANSISQLASDIAENAAGHYALANAYDASADGTYSSAPIPTTFTGTLEGLGNTVSNLTINDSSDNNVGLLAEVGDSGVVRDISLFKADITGGARADIGSLVGKNNGGTIAQSYVTETVVGGSGAVIGGLVGDNDGTILQSRASGAVAGAGKTYVGGLVGSELNGSISESYAAGTVTGGDKAFAVGGLIGDNDQGTIAQSYSTAAVTGGAGANVGGFVGVNNGTVDESYETGAAKGGKGSKVGGFAGSNNGTLGHTTAVYFNSDLNSAGVGSGVISNGGGLARAALATASNFSGWAFGTTPDGKGWVIVDQDGTFNNTSQATGGTAPMLLSEYSTTITNEHQLQLMDLNLSARYILSNDIDASGTAGGDVWGPQGFIPLGTNNGTGVAFTGVLEGANYTVSDLTIDDDEFGVGLFAQLGDGSGDGTVRDIGLVNVSVTATGEDSKVGGIAGTNTGTITASYVTGSIAGGSDASIGGLVGRNAYGLINKSHASGAVTDKGDGASLGGLVGDGVFGTIENSYAASVVSAGANSNAGGLIGINQEGTIDRTYATGGIAAGASAEAGGLVGENDGTVEQSYATGTVAAGTNSDAGGLVGISGGAIEQSYASGAVSASKTSDAGGLVGANNDTITQSYSLSAVKASGSSSNAGGFVGENGSGGTISQSYSVGTLTGSATKSGFAGKNDNTSASAITKSYWDKQTSGQSHAIGSGTAQAGVAGKTTKQLQGALPSGFSSSVWKIVAGKSFPYLAWQTASSAPQFVSGTTCSDRLGVSVGVLMNGDTATLISPYVAAESTSFECN